MKAAQLKDHGSVENFQIVDIPKPTFGPDDVLIKVHFAGLRWGDIMNRYGIPVRSAKVPFIPGQEATGVVAEVGKNVTRLKVGDRVVTQPNGGAYAEYLCMPAAGVNLVPEHVPLETALVYSVNLPTAYMLVYEWAKVQEGESVLVHAAAGGVGSLVIQILKRKFKNVKTIGLGGTDEKVKAILANGSDHAINYKKNDYVTEVEKIVGAKSRTFAPLAPPAGVHVVLNGVGGKALQTDRLVIRPLGRWVLFGVTSGMEPINVYANSYDSITIMPFSILAFLSTPAMRRAQSFTSDWLKLERLIAPTIHPIEDIAKVQRAMEIGETQGKIVFSL